jgi:hypothetical protein
MDPNAPPLPKRTSIQEATLSASGMLASSVETPDYVNAPSIPGRPTLRKPGADTAPVREYVQPVALRPKEPTAADGNGLPPPVPDRRSLSNGPSPGHSRRSSGKQVPLGYILVNLDESSASRKQLTSSTVHVQDVQKELAKRQLPRDNIDVVEPPLGTGFFGAVFRGTFRDPDGSKRDIAVKTLLKEDLEERDARLFLLEAQIMMEFSHPNGEFLVPLVVILMSDPHVWVCGVCL